MSNRPHTRSASLKRLPRMDAEHRKHRGRRRGLGQPLLATLTDES